MVQNHACFGWLAWWSWASHPRLILLAPADWAVVRVQEWWVRTFQHCPDCPPCPGCPPCHGCWSFAQSGGCLWVFLWSVIQQRVPCGCWVWSQPLERQGWLCASMPLRAFLGSRLCTISVENWGCSLLWIRDWEEDHLPLYYRWCLYRYLSWGCCSGLCTSPTSSFINPLIDFYFIQCYPWRIFRLERNFGWERVMGMDAIYFFQAVRH